MSVSGHSLRHDHHASQFSSKEHYMSEAKDKRKQGHDAAVSVVQKKAREEAAVTDEEVEEFYTVLRRINTAVKYFKSYGDDVAALEKDILQQVREATTTRNHDNEKEDIMEHNFTFDLNVTPQNPTL
ncbi:hypothetical protein Fmac_023136 [Flemingia macrophylla]|uniref:Uncharacterized protein n=1 Tax=Flemingia macrophylla TaxID=520843 RepID=A0ABD1LL56_9FABA